MAEDQGGQQQQESFNPQEARSYLQNFGHSVDRIPETELPTLYTTVKGNVDKMTQTHVETAIKERGEFGPNWRQALAGEDADALKTLERMQHPKDVFKSYSELRTKLSKGELKSSSPFPEKGTDEQKAAWRAEQGIPTKPEEYQVKAPQGVVFGEDDKPYIDGFLKHAHSKNMTPAAVNDAISWWGEERARRQEAAAEATTDAKKATDDALHAEWGPEYRPTMNRIDNLLGATVADETLRQGIKQSVATNPEFAKFMATVAFQLNPTSTLTPGDAGASVGSIEDGLKKIEGVMRSNRSAYNKDEKMQADYRNLLTGYQRLSGKAWGQK
tara:strand:- start:625 stop:1608 length:984 start_codon:yes stop_codon:yes gene_type:complete